MERTEVNVTTKICLHDVLVALDILSKDYPMERLAEYQIERIEGAARILRSRMKDYEDAKDSKTTTTTGTITPVTSNVTMPSGWSFSGLAPIVVDLRGNAADRRTYNACGAPSRRSGKGRREGDVWYSTLPYYNCSICYEEFHSYSCVRPSHGVPTYKERRIRGERRKVRDQRKCEYSRLTNNTGRRITDKTSFTTLPRIEERRELGVETRRKVQDASNKHLRRTLNMYGRRRTDTTPYNTYPLVNAYETVQAKAERRVNATSRRKVNDWSHPNRTKRTTSYGPAGRRNTDRESYTLLPVINTDKAVAPQASSGTTR
jgi:hypothetical protein